MVGKVAWPGGVAYVDLFAGPGACRIRGTAKRLPGSPLIAAHAPKALSRIIACEEQPDLADACEKRLLASPAADCSVVFSGNCNQRMSEIIAAIPPDALTLAFIDPEALHIEYDSIARLSRAGAVDLLILFADAFDVLRNVDEHYVPNPGSRLDRFLGSDANWRAGWASLGNQGGARARDFFMRVYQQQLRKLGYGHFGEQRISSRSGPLYRLVYASKNSRGLDFWEKAKSKDKGGQSQLF